ncbi:toxin-antitoxin system YwqK family antitoxin [Bizionia gelidisalsuginis]|uniref:Toxin-antitoxin system YwqK family antitoxin n=1 Tax=Bizionia gelidisalsuginis TaxID=291188 RepID=A0ABY3MDM9_9FLAO|nr:toxin-antitoxin system YwqK family antitoxin [Bizionia gelidisalsuginis]TYC17042.1 toxin-antitoxin system YwqK family antitoxin [Bizionia gelidisalsuginis]
MKTIFILIFCSFSVFVSAQDINQFDNQGARHGKWTKNYEGSEILRYEGEFNHGKELGTFKFYKNVDGRAVLSVTREFNPNNDVVQVTFYDGNKNIVSKGVMKNKIQIGEWVYFHNNGGEVMMEEVYNDDGEIEGEKKTYYKTGSIAEQALFKGGVLNGVSQWFSDKGTLIRLFNYTNGALDGPSKSYDSKGNVTMEGVYRNDLKHGIWKYYENGKLVKEKDFTKRSQNLYKSKQK